MHRGQEKHILKEHIPSYGMRIICRINPFYLPWREATGGGGKIAYEQ